MKLVNASKNKTVATKLEVAKSFWSRVVGLLGRKDLHSEEALWINSCNGIHTCFMKFPIDVVFVDSEFKIESVHTDIKPWRFVWAGEKGKSVIELRGGRASELKLEIGDQLHVAT